MDFLAILLLFILIVIIGFDVYLLIKIEKQLKEKKKIENEDLFYKLNAKIDLHKFLAYGLIIIAGFWGFYRFDDLSNSLKSLNNIESKYHLLEIEYENLNISFNELENKHQQLIDKINESNNSINKYELDLINLDYKLKELSRDIPEENIKVISKYLAESYLTAIIHKGVWVDYPYDLDHIKNEIERVKQLLKSNGFIDNEISIFLKNIIDNTYLKDSIIIK